jgi:limonene-1,2-epoxide hydrolase
MSANVEIVRELYRAFKEKDYDAFALIYDEAICRNQNPGFPNGHRYVGAQAVS